MSFYADYDGQVYWRHVVLLWRVVVGVFGVDSLVGDVGN